MNIFDFLRAKGKVGRFELKPSIRGKVAALFLFFVFLTLAVVFLKGRLSLEALAISGGEKVLGIFIENHQLGGIGEIRAQTGSLANFLGYFITSVTIGVVGYFGMRRKGLWPGGF